jgi:hypothetical protein
MTRIIRTVTVSIRLIGYTVDEEAGANITNAEEALPTIDTIVADSIMTDPGITTVTTEAMIEEVYEEVTVEDIEDDKTLARRSTIYITSQATSPLYIPLRSVERYIIDFVNKLSIR